MGKQKDKELEKMIEEIKVYNFSSCVILKNIASAIGTLCISLDEWCMLNQIADNAINKMIKSNLVPKGITESDLRSMLPDGTIPESKWKTNLLNKFNRVV